MADFRRAANLLCDLQDLPRRLLAKRSPRRPPRPSSSPATRTGRDGPETMHSSGRRGRAPLESERTRWLSGSIGAARHYCPERTGVPRARIRTPRPPRRSEGGRPSSCGGYRRSVPTAATRCRCGIGHPRRCLAARRAHRAPYVRPPDPRSSAFALPARSSGARDRSARPPTRTNEADRRAGMPWRPVWESGTSWRCILGQATSEFHAGNLSLFRMTVVHHSFLTRRAGADDHRTPNRPAHAPTGTGDP